MAVKTICRDCLWRAHSGESRCSACRSPRVVRHDELDSLTIAHVDCDAFYASVEKRDRPELRDLPVIVGGGKRGVVAAACYVARQYGVRSAMPMFKALKACPGAVVLQPDFERYKAESQRIFARLRRMTPLVQTLSLDEAWLDLSGTERLHGGPAALQLVQAQRDIEQETGLSVSVGLSCNKFLAKIASDLDKPRGFSVIGAGDAGSFLASYPVAILPGVGPAFARTLASDGFNTVGQLASADSKRLASLYGEHGLRLARLARGQDHRPVDPQGERKGMSAETTFNEDLTSLEALEGELWPLCEKLAIKARKSGLSSRVVVLKLRTDDFHIHTRRRTLGLPTCTARTLFDVAREMLRGEIDGRRFRLIGVAMADLIERGPLAADLFGGAEAKALRTETVLDGLRERFGEGVIGAGRSLRK